MALRDNAIVAYAETKVMEKSDRDVFGLAGGMLEAVLDNTGVDKNEIDGFVMAGLTGTGAANPFWAQTTADVLGLDVGFCEQVATGGCSAAGCVARAAAAIDYGMCEVAFLLFADTHVLEDRTDHSHSYRREWTDPYGLMGPPGAFGLLTRAYEAKYGLDYRMLGKLAVTQRNHALLNETACQKLRVPITIADYMNSLIIAIMLQFEAFGFCKAGEGAPFIRDHDFSYNGDLPLNTGGGQISAGQAACSSHNLVEAVRQLRGEGGKRQVKDTRNALVTGIGWINYGRNWGSSAALVLVPE